MTRKIVQLCATDENLVVLADDGTLWFRMGSWREDTSPDDTLPDCADYWHQIPPLPQPPTPGGQDT